MKYMKQVIALGVAAVFALESFVCAFAESGSEKSKTNSDELVDYSWLVFESFTEPSYIDFRETATLPKYSGEKLDFTVEEDLKLGDECIVSVEVPSDGLYEIHFTYKNSIEQYLPTEFSMQIDGTYYFYEMRRLYLESNWIDGEVTYDRYGNEMVPQPYAEDEFQKKGLNDSSFRTTDPFLFPLTKGTHELKINISDGAVSVPTISLEGAKAPMSYTYNEAAGTQYVMLEAEKMSSKNASGIHATGEYNTDLTPYDKRTRLLNFLDGTSFYEAGAVVGYDFEAVETGYYQLTFDYRQNAKPDFPVFCNVIIDGEVPHEALMRVPFMYSSQFKRYTPVDESGNPITFYLEKGTHRISLQIDIENLAGVYSEVEALFKEINGLSTEIVRLTGGITTDKYRNYSLDDYLPGLPAILYSMADRCDDIMTSMSEYSDVERVGAFAPIEICAKMLRNLAKKPNEIPRRLSELSTGVSSVTKYLGQLMQEMGNNGLSLDTIYVHQKDAKLPQELSFSQKFYEGIKRFLISYAFQDYGVKSVNPAHLQVWMARSRQYVEILQNMADSMFTPETKIEVDISVMPDQSKLALASAAGKAPDVALSVGYVLPSYLSIRGALMDLKQYKDFDTIIDRFPEGLFLPGICQDGVYAIPETINFWVMFYRKDIFESLGLNVPNTLDEVKGILPELQRRSMNFYYPTAGMVGTKLFPATIPFLLQAGGSVFAEEIGHTTIDSEQSLRGFTELTDLFTIYDLPVDVPAPGFYQKFRSGELPIGIADISTYNLLLNSAPELAGLWDLSVFPGIADENGEILRYTTGGAESDVIFANTGKPNEAWEFLKWWSSDDVQALYGNTLTSTYGKTYLWNTANINAFAKLPLQSSHKETIIAQSEWMIEVPWVPGTYMVERELSNAYYNVVTDGMTVRRAMDTAVKRINREMDRKLEEFGFTRGGEKIKPFYTPNTDILYK